MGAKFEVVPDSRALAGEILARAQEFPKAAERASRRISEKYAKAVKAAMRAQAFPNLALTAGWAARKAKLGLDPRTLFATQAYYRSIRAEKAGEWWGVVCNDDVLRKRLEYGTKTSPPRPHWTPVLLQFSGNFQEEFSEILSEEILGGAK